MQTRAEKKQARIKRKIIRRQIMNAKFKQAIDEWGLSNRRMKIRYQY